MKAYFTCLLGIFLSFIGFAQQPIFSSAQIEDARVFYNGAELHQKALLDLPKGQSEIVISNISNQVDENSVRLGTKGITILSVQYSNSYIEEYDNVDTSPLSQPLRDSITKLESDLYHLDNAISTEEQAIKTLDLNSTSDQSSLKFSSTEEMKKWITYYQEKRQELKNGLWVKKKKKEQYKDRLADLKARLQLNVQPGSKTGQGKLIIQIMAEQAAQYPIKIQYVTNSANWRPSYDLEIEDIQNPIQLLYKADVRQSTGLDWKNVNLSLTSGGLNKNEQIPEWNNWFIGYMPPPPPPAHASEVIAVEDRGLEEGEMANNKMSYAKIAVENTSTLSAYTSTSENELRQSYNISMPYTILSNGKGHSVTLKDAELEADYAYYSAPKLDPTVYLTAKVADYGSLHLLSGEANIVFDGMFIGKTPLSIANTDEDLTLNLGQDPNVSIDRKLISDKSGTKFLSSKKEQNFTYEITIKNNKNQPIKLNVEDQFPLSKEKSIEIELTQTSKAKVKKEEGVLSWNLDLKPGETKKLRFGYQVKSDKTKNVFGI